jgi:hypothetical protein
MGLFSRSPADAAAYAEAYRSSLEAMEAVDPVRDFQGDDGIADSDAPLRSRLEARGDNIARSP